MTSLVVSVEADAGLYDDNDDGDGDFPIKEIHSHLSFLTLEIYIEKDLAI